MTDIVEKLRDPSKGSPRWGDTMAEAADEIERLRRAFLREIQRDNSCVFTGERCRPERCDCLAEMEMLVRSARQGLAEPPTGLEYRGG